MNNFMFKIFWMDEKSHQMCKVPCIFFSIDHHHRQSEPTNVSRFASARRARSFECLRARNRKEIRSIRRCVKSTVKSEASKKRNMTFVVLMLNEG